MASVRVRQARDVLICTNWERLRLWSALTAWRYGEHRATMASTKGDGTAAVASQQLGFMSIASSPKSKDNDTEQPNAKNGTTQLCSACGKKSSTLKKCTTCKCVWYCDKECQNNHCREHGIECLGIKNVLDGRGGKLDVGTELDIGPVEKLPPREECLICMQVMPLHTKLQCYFACCGKRLCNGCNYEHQTKSREMAAERGQTLLSPTCAFCREPMPRSDEETLAQGYKRMELGDPNAMATIAMAYGHGRLGLPVDQAKCIALLTESAGLGSTEANSGLGIFHDFGQMGLEQSAGKSTQVLRGRCKRRPRSFKAQPRGRSVREL